MIQPEYFEPFMPFGRKFCYNHPFGGKTSLEGKEEGIFCDAFESDDRNVLDSMSASGPDEKWKITTVGSDGRCEEEVRKNDRIYELNINLKRIVEAVFSCYNMRSLQQFFTQFLRARNVLLLEMAGAIIGCHNK